MFQKVLKKIILFSGGWPHWPDAKVERWSSLLHQRTWSGEKASLFVFKSIFCFTSETSKTFLYNEIVHTVGISVNFFPNL